MTWLTRLLCPQGAHASQSSSRRELGEPWAPTPRRGITLEEELGQWGSDWGANPGPGSSCPPGAQVWVTRQGVSPGRPSVTRADEGQDGVAAAVPTPRPALLSASSWVTDDAPVSRPPLHLGQAPGPGPRGETASDRAVAPRAGHSFRAVSLHFIPVPGR